MQTPNTKVLKSKSSNSAIATKSDTRKNNKKSRSNGEFQPQIVKKRGVYVEKKSADISDKDPADILPKKLSKCQGPRPGKNRFLASVLTILSKSTASTQFPEQKDQNASEKVKKKPKYRSKFLNADNNSDIAQLVILKSTKEIILTPSVASEDKISHTMVANPIKRVGSRLLYVKGNSNVGILKTESKNIEDSKMIPEKKVTIIDKDPDTLVAEQPKEDKRFYNFFVDLLETSFDVYNGDTVFELPPANVTSVDNSKGELAIDEAVAKKLVIEKTKASSVNFDDSTKIKHYQIPTNEYSDHIVHNMHPKIVRKRSIALPPKTSIKKSQLKSASFESAPKKKISEKRKRKNFLNSLKEELKKSDDFYEEPQTIFQALQVMARNKRRCQKSIHYKDNTSDISERDYRECTFKRRKLLTAKIPSVDTNRSLDPYFRNTLKSSRNNPVNITPTISKTEFDPSQHSLQVYGYLYETPSRNQIPEEDSISFHSMHSETDFEFDGETVF